MSARRILLIDSDPDFHARLQENFGPYGFEIYTAPEDANALSQVKEVGPEVIFIAVELPDKTGYSLCNKAKKGVAKQIPVVLTTASVPPSGFNSHRKLKVHADEYVDKRMLTDQELVDKLNALVGVGEAVLAPEDEFDLPVDIEEISLDDDSEEAEEIMLDDELMIDEVDDGDFDDGKTRVAPPSILIDDGVSDETDAAFAAIGFGDDDEPLLDEIEIPNDFEGAEPATNAGDAMEELAAIAEAPPAQPEAIPEAVPEAVPEPAFTADELEAAADAEPVPEPAAQQLPEMEEEFDLGLDAVAELAEEEASGIHDRGDVNEIQELQGEVDRLRSELDAAKASGGSEFSREREFLNLREVINKKEKEVLDLRDEIGAKDRQILDSKEKIQSLERARADLDAKALGLEQKVLGANETAAAIDKEKTAGLAREAALGDKLAGLEAQLSAANQRVIESEAAVQQANNDAAAAMTAAQEQHAAAMAAAKASHGAAIELLSDENAVTLAGLRDEHDGALASANAEAAAQLEQARTEHDGAMQALRDEHNSELASLQKAYNRDAEQKETEKAEALEAAAADKAAALAAAEERREQDVATAVANGEAALEAANEESGKQLAALSRAHDSDKASLEKAKQEELEAAEQKRQQDLEAAIEQGRLDMATAEAKHHAAVEGLREENATALAAAEQRREQDIAAAEARRRADMASAAEERAAAENALQEKYEGEKATMEQSHGEAITALEGERSQLEAALNGAREQITGLEGDVAAAVAVTAERDGEIDKHKDTILARDSRISALKQRQLEIEAENTGYQEQVLKAFQKIKADTEVVERAKKAMAIAITLLDENIGDEQGAPPAEEPASDG